MSHFPEFHQRTPGVCGAGVRAVGWLAREHDYARGAVPEELVARLKYLRSSPSTIFTVFEWWPAFAGPHTCELCNAHYDSGELVVPYDDVVFIAPTMIVHYVEQHAYQPPADFVRAVMVCAELDSPQYFEALARIARRDESGRARVRWDDPRTR